MPQKETLVQKQARFTRMLGELIVWAFGQGYVVTLGEVQRTSEQARKNAETGIGITRSLHLLCLAADLKQYVGDMYCTRSEDYLKLGEKWESMGGTWGGRFKDKNGKPKPDGGHFSLEHNGVK